MTAPYLLLLPGLMCDKRLWRHQVDALADLCVPVVADLTRATSIEGMARDALTQVTGPFALAGLPMGGIVAFEIWRQAPERVSRLMLFDTNARADLPERKNQRREQIGRVLSGALNDVVIDELKPLYVAQANRANSEFMNEIVAMALDLGEQVFVRQSSALRDRPDSAETLPTITCPTVVACGREDRLCPIAFHEFMAARIPRCQLRLIEGAGHLPTLERPRQVTALMRRWLQHQKNFEDVPRIAILSEERA